MSRSAPEKLAHVAALCSCCCPPHEHRQRYQVEGSEPLALAQPPGSFKVPIHFEVYQEPPCSAFVRRASVTTAQPSIMTDHLRAHEPHVNISQCCLYNIAMDRMAANCQILANRLRDHASMPRHRVHFSSLAMQRA